MADLKVSQLSPIPAAVLADLLYIVDISAGTSNKIPLEELRATIAVTLTAGPGLSGGGDTSADRVFNLDLNNLATDAAFDKTADFIPYRDTSGAADKKLLIEDLLGSVVQEVNVQTGDHTTTAAVIPQDDSIPQIGEGVELFNVTITPKSDNNILKFIVQAHMANTAGSPGTIAVFQDATANALAASHHQLTTPGHVRALMFAFRMTAGTTSPTTFRLRFGGAGSTTSINGAGSRLLGGVLMTSMTVTELRP